MCSFMLSYHTRVKVSDSNGFLILCTKLCSFPFDVYEDVAKIGQVRREGMVDCDCAMEMSHVLSDEITTE